MDLFKKAEKHFLLFNRNHKPQSVYRQVSCGKNERKDSKKERI